MSAISQLAKVTEMIAEATAMIQKMQECLPALIAAAGAETAVSHVEAPVVADKKEKKPASDGTMAWHAFVKHVQETQPSRFADFKKHSEVLHEAKSIREEDDEGYKSFVSSWKAARLTEPSAPVSTVEEVVVIAQAPVKTEVKEKRKAAPGTLAWAAFVKHCKTTMPEAFSAATKESEKLQIAKGIRAQDMSSYEAFTSQWKAANAIMA